MQRVIHLVGDRLHLAVSRERAGRVGVGVRVDHAHAAGLRQIVIRERAELLLGHARPQQQCTHCVRYGQFRVFACAVGDERSAVDVCQIGIRHGGRAAVVHGERRAGQKRQHHAERQHKGQNFLAFCLVHLSFSFQKRFFMVGNVPPRTRFFHQLSAA